MARFALSDMDEADWLPGEARTLLERLLSKSQTFTGRVDGRVVAICGITQIHPHYAKVWSYLHPLALVERFWLHRKVKRILADVVGASDYWRVEADCYTRHVAAHAWLKKLGFRKESDMPLYGPQGELMTRYVWYPRGLICG